MASAAGKSAPRGDRSNPWSPAFSALSGLYDEKFNVFHRERTRGFALSSRA
jgi:hypothetical protein